MNYKGNDNSSTCNATKFGQCNECVRDIHQFSPIQRRQCNETGFANNNMCIPCNSRINLKWLCRNKLIEVKLNAEQKIPSQRNGISIKCSKYLVQFHVHVFCRGSALNYCPAARQSNMDQTAINLKRDQFSNAFNSSASFLWLSLLHDNWEWQVFASNKKIVNINYNV